MATTKKSSVKKRVSSAKKSAAKSRSTRPVRISAPQSLRLEKDRDNFMNTTLTNQSVYWIVFGIVVIAFASWILKVQADIQDIYDKIEQNHYAVIETPAEYKDKLKNTSQ